MFELIPVAQAQVGITYTDLTTLTFGDMIYLLAALAILGMGALSIIFIFYGGFSFILSMGDEAKVKEAMSTIRYAIIGLIVAILSIVIVPIIGRLFGLNLNFLSFGTLSNKINILFDQFKAPEEAVTAVDETQKPAADAITEAAEDAVQNTDTGIANNLDVLIK